MLAGDLTTLELDDLIEKVKTRSNRGVKQIKAAIKAARIERYKPDKEEERQRLEAERNDSRPELIRMPDDSPQTEEMAQDQRRRADDADGATASAATWKGT